MGHLHDQLFSFGIQHPLDRCCITVEGLLDPFLPAVGQDVLVQVPFRVHEPDGNERDPEIAALLEVIAGKETKTPGIERKRVLEPVLGREVGDREIAVMRVPGGKPAVLGIQLVPEPAHHDIVMPEVLGVVGSGKQGLFGKFMQHPHRVMDTLAPCRGVELLEDQLYRRIPAPPEVVGKVNETGDPFRDMREPFPAQICHISASVDV